MRPQDFYTRTRASAGIRIELKDPAGHKEWVRVRSVISEEHRKAREELVRQAIADGRAVAEDPSQRKALARRRRAVLAASLIAEWSIPVGPVDLLIKNPRLRRQIELIAENHALHFGVEK
ncbi:hypothetical protein [Stutzerimonas stutzeri]|uniref:hypothetical protein n=1 Tax=Stutzerimonas stutzeri TaxID=316 RepID=UPI001260316D|nr:hypothetical protein [Stutzerimonas stutzeri]